MSTDDVPQRDVPREPMAEDEFVIPCCVDGCKQPSQMPASEYCRVHSYIDAAPAAAPAVMPPQEPLGEPFGQVLRENYRELIARDAAPAAPAPDDRIRSESWDATRVAIPKQRLAAPAPAPAPKYCTHAWEYGMRRVGCVINCGLPRAPAESALPARAQIGGDRG